MGKGLLAIDEVTLQESKKASSNLVVAFASRPVSQVLIYDTAPETSPLTPESSSVGEPFGKNRYGERRSHGPGLMGRIPPPVIAFISQVATENRGCPNERKDNCAAVNCGC